MCLCWIGLVRYAIGGVATIFLPFHHWGFVDSVLLTLQPIYNTVKSNFE